MRYFNAYSFSFFSDTLEIILSRVIVKKVLKMVEKQTPKEALEHVINVLARKTHKILSDFTNTKRRYSELQKDILSREEKTIMGILNRLIALNDDYERSRIKLANLFQFLEEYKLKFESISETNTL